MQALAKQGENSMQKLALTRNAFDRFYGSSRLIIMSADLYTPVANTIPPLIDVLLLDQSGGLRVPDEDTSPETLSLLPVGAPVGLLGLVVGRQLEDTADAWANWFLAQTGRSEPKVWTVEASDAALTMQRLAEIAVIDADHSRLAAAGIQTDLAVLRRDFERSLINLEKARRIIRGAGYGTRYSTLTVPAGTKTTGPAGITSPLAPFILRYGLPVDAAGVVGISLHCVIPVGAIAEGHLTMLLKRSVDGRILGRAQVLFSELSAGWIYLELERGLQRSFGDAELVFEWVVAGEGTIPVISLTDGAPDRCGTLPGGIGADGEDASPDQAQKTLPAMQIWSGFAPGDLADDHGFSGVPMEHRRTTVSELLPRGTVIAEESVADAVVSLDDSAGWVQTHLQANGPVGLSFGQMVPASARALTVACETAHQSAPTCFYMVAVGGSLVLSQDHLAQLLKNGKDGGDTSGFDRDIGAAWSIQTIAPGVSCEIDVDLSKIANDLPAQNLSMVVVSTSGAAEYGWCRWHNVSVKLDTVSGNSTAYQSSAGSRPLVQRMRSVKFPEIGERLEFLAGRAKLQTLTDQLGFSPMIVADDNGSLQTHPIKQDISAALYRSGAGAGTTRVACDVETAHERAPDFMYVLALLNASTTDKYGAFQNFANRLVNEEFHVAKGYDDKSEVYYSARRLSALQVESLSVDLDVPLAEDYDIIVAALPVHHIISYGWCRWLSLSVATIIDNHQQFDLRAVDQ